MDFDLDDTPERPQSTPWAAMLVLLAGLTIVCATVVAVVYLLVS